MEPIFKVGDIVRIVDLHQLEKSDVPFHVAQGMLSLSGVLAEITRVEFNIYDLRRYKYDSSEFPNYNKPDGCRYCLKAADIATSKLDLGWQWSSPMLERANKTELDSKAELDSKDSNSPLRIKVTRKSIVLNFKN